MLKQFSTREELIAAYGEAHAAEYFAKKEDYDVFSLEDAARRASVHAEGLVKYHPHIYCGGSVIPEFGYSTERIEKYVSANRAGNPLMVGVKKS